MPQDDVKGELATPAILNLRTSFIRTEPKRREESAFDVSVVELIIVKNGSFVPQDDVKGELATPAILNLRTSFLRK